MKGPVPGFSKGVNDTLVGASTLVHLKATGLLGFALTLSGIVISHPPSGGFALTLHFSGVLILIASACCSGAAIYPLKKTRKGGLLFWGDIASHPGASDYAEALDRLKTPEDVDREYAFTNYRLSLVLDVKYGLVRWAVVQLLAGSALAGAGRALG